MLPITIKKIIKNTYDFKIKDETENQKDVQNTI